MTPESIRSFPKSVVVTDTNKIQVEGETAGELLTAMFGDAPEGFGEVVVVDGINIGRITPTRYLILTNDNITDKLNAAIGDRFITITDQSNGLSSFHLEEEGAVDILSQLCGLDFNAKAFPINSVKSSSFAKIRATIWHLADGWHVWIGRSYTQYILDIIRAAEATR